MKRKIPIFIASFIGIYMVVQYGITKQTWFGGQLETGYEWLNDWYIVGSIMVLIIAIGNILRVHLQKVKRMSPGWGYSIITIVALVGYCVVAFFPSIPVGEAKDRVWLYIYYPLDQSMFSLLAFFIASAAYRAFRFRNVEASLMLITATVIMLSRVPVGSYIYQHLPAFGDWILSVPAMAAKRGILIGIALGVIATCLKIILGIEKPYLGGSR